jgi:hypothetical protein
VYTDSRLFWSGIKSSSVGLLKRCWRLSARTSSGGKRRETRSWRCERASEILGSACYSYDHVAGRIRVLDPACWEKSGPAPTMRSDPIALANFSSVSSVGRTPPPFTLAMVEWLVPMRSTSRAWVTRRRFEVGKRRRVDRVVSTLGYLTSFSTSSYSISYSKQKS